MSTMLYITLLFNFLLIVTSVNGQRRRCPPSSPSTSPPGSSNSSIKLQQLRKKLIENQVQGYLIPLSDEHLSEVISDSDNRLLFLTGFDGSNGLALVIDTENGSKNILFTDSRYNEAADEQLDCNWMIHLCRDLLDSAMNWIKVNADPQSKIAADVRLFNLKDWLRLNEFLQNSGHTVMPQSYNLIDDIWDKSSKPVAKTVNETKLFIHDLEYSGKSWQDKVSDVMVEVESKNGHSLIVSSLEEVAWLLNLRGNDIDYTPIFKSYVVIVSRTLIWLFVDQLKVTEQVRQHLNSNNCGQQTQSQPIDPCVVIKDYSEFLWSSSEVVNAVTNYYNTSTIKILIPQSTNYYVYGMIPEQFKTSITESPVAVLKCVKNDIEINGMKSAHVKDAVALIDFMARLTNSVQQKSTDFDSGLNELSVTRLLTKFRSEQKLNRGESFPTISAVNDNAAKAHYQPSNTSSRFIDLNSIYLVDSGGQYLDGTTDVTRVLVFNNDVYLNSGDGEKSSRTSSTNKVRALKDIYTRILMGQIDMTTFVFPADTKAKDVTDVLARRHLAEVGLTYGHGTSHGIGSYLMVHENSIYIGSSSSLNIPLKEGMFTSIEPGFYEPGSVNVHLWPSGKQFKVDGFGMRLENIVQVVEAKLPQLIVDPDHGPINGKIKFLTFDPVTLVPYEKRLINYDLLQLNHKRWLNKYNSRIRLIVGKELKAQNRTVAYDYMMDMTEPIAEVESRIDESDCNLLQSVSTSSGNVKVPGVIIAVFLFVVKTMI